MKKKYIAPQTMQVNINTGCILQSVSGSGNTNNTLPPIDQNMTNEPADSRSFRYNEWDDEDEDF